MWVLIAVYNISKRYGDQLILDHISAEFHTGNIYCIVGENGSGKTVFLKCICGLISCSEGEIHIKGIPLRSENCLSGEIGAIIERPGFYRITQDMKTYIILQHYCIPQTRIKFDVQCTKWVLIQIAEKK